MPKGTNRTIVKASNTTTNRTELSLVRFFLLTVVLFLGFGCNFVGMAAPKGNKYWQFRGKHGRDYKYQPEELWNEAVQYFEWVEDNPLLEEKGFAFQGVVTKETFAKMRAMTITGFCLFADIALKTFEEYKQLEDFSNIVTRIENIIREQKFTGAAAELLNPNIIARDLGLSDRSNTVIEIPEDTTKAVKTFMQMITDEPG